MTKVYEIFRFVGEYWLLILIGILIVIAYGKRILFSIPNIVRVLYHHKKNNEEKEKRSAVSSVKTAGYIYMYFILFFGVLYFLGAYFAYIEWSTPIFKITGDNFSVGPGIAILVIWHIALSLKTVAVDELGGIFFYGLALKRAKSGLCYVPFGVTQLVRLSALMQEFQFPGEPEMVFKGDDKEPLPYIEVNGEKTQMVRPIRVVTRSATDEEKDLLDVSMTISVNFVVQFQIKNIFDFLKNFGSIQYLVRQLRDIGETTLAERIAQKTVKGVMRDLKKINEGLLKEIQEKIIESGVIIRSARMISPDITHEVSVSLSNIPKEKARAQETRIKAEAELFRLTQEGKGKANAIQASLYAKAKGRLRMAKELGVDGAAVLASETAEKSLENANTIIIGAEGMKDAMGFVKATQEAFNSTVSKTPIVKAKK